MFAFVSGLCLGLLIGGLVAINNHTRALYYREYVRGYINDQGWDEKVEGAWKRFVSWLKGHFS